MLWRAVSWTTSWYTTWSPTTPRSWRTWSRDYPGVQILCNAMAKTMVGQFFGPELAGRITAVKEGDPLHRTAHPALRGRAYGPLAGGDDDLRRDGQAAAVGGRLRLLPVR